MKLIFKRRFFGFIEKEVPIILKIGTLIDLCKELEIDFWQLNDFSEKNKFDFMAELLWQGYLTACRELYKKPKYDKVKAFFWYEYLSQDSQEDLVNKMNILTGEFQETFNKKKVRQK